MLPRLNEDGLVRLATAGGGSYRRIRVDDGDFKALLAHLDHHDLDNTGKPAQRLGDRWEEAGVWLLWPLALLSAAAFRRGWLAVVALALMLPAGARAAGWNDLWQRSDQQAYGAFKAQAFERAGKGFDDPRWKASALYRAGQYEAAIEALPPPQTADDWYNRANTLARSGRLKEALDAYDKALKRHPDDTDARENRRMVKEALEQQQKKPNPASQPGQNGQDQESGQNRQDQETGQKGQDRESGQPDKSGQPSGDGRPSSSRGDGGLSSAAKPDRGNDRGDKGGEATQAPADAAPAAPNPPAQGNASAESDGDTAHGRAQAAAARPQSAKNPTSEDSPPQAAGGEADPPIDAEQRQMQQWLQRIPDDPGGLLRRKFLYQYRQRGQQMETDRPW